MASPITLTKLVAWAGPRVVKEAESILAQGLVLEAEHEGPYIRGSISVNGRPLKTEMKILPDGTAESHCPCYMNKERGLICAHVMALGLHLLRRATDPEREQDYRAEARRAARVARINEADYIRRVPEGSPGALPAVLSVSLAPDWQAGYHRGAIPVFCALEYRGQQRPLDEVPRDIPLILSHRDESILFVLEDISEGPAKSHIELSRFDFINLIGLHAGHLFARRDGAPIVVNEARMTTFLHMDLDRETGEIILIAHTELPFMKPGEFPFYVVSGKSGWVFGADNFWPLENVLPTPYHAVYEEPVIIPRREVLRFLQQELPVLSRFARVESDISSDLFSIEPAAPKFRLAVRGSPASLSATLYALYGEVELVAVQSDPRGSFAIPDPKDIMRYEVRDLEAEKRALGYLQPSRFMGAHGGELTPIVGKHNVLNFLGSQMPALRRRGWKVDLEGRVAPYLESLDFANPIVRIEAPEQADWFDVGFDFENGTGASISAADIQLAIRRGESYIEKGGQTILVDSDAVSSMLGVFSDCNSMDSDRPGHFRMSGVYSAFVKSSLNALDGVDVEDAPAWRLRAERANRTMEIHPVELKEPLRNLLRPYQKQGVYWLRFLEENGFCGLLADEMGLGKTLQTLAWLQLARQDPKVRSLPALIVCPTSIVDNWAEEAARFAPDLEVTTFTGSDRHQLWPLLSRTDVAVTSYALLRRDLERYTSVEFAAAVLDEAQHIKNRSTQNARAAKQIRANHRLVLTGTPIENSVSDLWSIMDFLMPGYLGSHDSFRLNYEAPITRGGADAENAQARLRRKLQPFLLRRLKRDVASDLPPKIQRVSTCVLTPDQRLVYNELLKASQNRISGLVAKKGFNKCRMEILTTLMRLRQTCCHLDLLKLEGLKPKLPSAKLDLFLELVDEAMDSGHRILVFSQFVTMLHILRDELDKRELSYCYLDGSTKDRMQVVRQFNSQRQIPLFLISLKAGGTGLNLTGADMVIHFDPWWNPAVEDQATDRAYRIGQKRTVYSIKLIAKDTVEEKVVAMQQKKKAVIDATIESDEAVMQTMTWDDVRELLSL